MLGCGLWPRKSLQNSCLIVHESYILPGCLQREIRLSIVGSRAGMEQDTNAFEVIHSDWGEGGDRDFFFVLFDPFDSFISLSGHVLDAFETVRPSKVMLGDAEHWSAVGRPLEAE